jgi:hypothetical protein
MLRPMNSIPRALRGFGAASIVLVAVCIAAGTGGAAGEVATSSLSRVIVEDSLPGFTLVPGGAYNGPIPKSDLDKYSDAAQWQQDVADRQLSGYVRAWSHQYQRGLGFLYWSALKMPDAAYAPQFTSTMEAFISKQPGATSLLVSGVTGATGYRTSPPVQIGRATGYWVVFTRGTVGFFLYAVGPPRTLTTAQIGVLAREQANHVSTE